MELLTILPAAKHSWFIPLHSTMISGGKTLRENISGLECNNLPGGVVKHMILLADLGPYLNQNKFAINEIGFELYARIVADLGLI
jgi:hypothetical protein